MARIPAETKKRLFVAALIKNGRNATKAAIAAGFSKKTAKQAGARLLSRVDVRAMIDASIDRVVEKAELKAQDILDELRKVGFANLSAAYAPDGSLLHPSDMPVDVQVALQAVETEELYVGRGMSRTKVGESKKVKLADKIRALELLGKNFKLWTDVTEHQGGAQPVVILTMPANGKEAVKEGIELKHDGFKDMSGGQIISPCGCRSQSDAKGKLVTISCATHRTKEGDGRG